jgi:hypothetical protein
MMKKPLLIGVLVALVSCLTSEVAAQDVAFSRAVPCPSDNAIEGYVDIADLNLDMIDELSRIVAGGADPPGDYMMLLCPGELFDATSSAILPLLDNLMICCGSCDLESPDPCVVQGGDEQVRFEDVDGITVNFVTIMGVTFEAFTGTSVNLLGSAPMQATFINSIWQVRAAEIDQKCNNVNPPDSTWPLLICFLSVVDTQRILIPKAFSL